MKFHCSKCGVELTHVRKAVSGKGYIFDLIDPHECEGYAIKANEDEKPTVLDILETLKPVAPVQVISDGKNEEGRYTEPGDRRSDDSKKTSSAPDSLVKAIRESTLPTTE